MKSDYEAIDRDMSSWVVSAKKKRTFFYLTGEGLATDALSRAARYRWADQADAAANIATQDPAWSGFRWIAASVPECFARKAAR